MELVQQTLAEQMFMTSHELEKRKNLLSFSREDEELLKLHKPLVNKKLDEIVESFYLQQVEFPEISLLIGDSETLRRLKSAMRRYILELFDGIYDLEYVNRRLRIGKVHQRIGVSPKLYISAIRILEEVLFESLEKSLSENSELAYLRKALNKLMMLDTQLVFDTYIASLVAEVESAREELQQYTSTLEQTIAERTAQLEELSSKDSLTGIFNQRSFYEQLRRELLMAERFKETLCICYLDLNRFKLLNDNKGHFAGDKVLSIMGESLVNALRETDIACRYGGDEFVLIFPRTNTDEVKQIMERVIEKFKNSHDADMTFSAGISETGPEEFTDLESLVKDADKKMYRAKDKSRKKDGFYIEV